MGTCGYLTQFNRVRDAVGLRSDLLTVEVDFLWRTSAVE
jgi:hypothetical protein